VLAEVVRSGLTESRHRASVVVLDPEGRVLRATGQVTAPFFPRSVNKPMQAAAMLQAGLDLDGALLALAAASHSGEDFHAEGVREILSPAGLTEEDLRCPPSLPLDDQAAAAVLQHGGQASRRYMNCSGKHAAMLATCVRAGWPTASYLDPDHPLQRSIRGAVAGLAGEPVTACGVDGCGAPLFALSLTGVARALQAMVIAPPGSAERRVADAMRAYPAWTSGSRRPERALMAAVPGLLLKSGAEGVEGFALADGRAVAYKIEDGSGRARPALSAALLGWLGAGGPDAAPVLAELGEVPVLGGGRPVGSVRVTLPW
jgi:L-asparaginase II